MRYVCVHCGHRFEQAEGGDLRCPKCMRTSGLEPTASAGATGRTRPRWLVPAAVGGLLLALGVGYAVWAATSADVVGDEVALRPLGRNGVRGHLRRLGLEAQAGELAALLTPTEAIERFAAEATRGVDGDRAKAEAVVEALRARASEGAFVRWPRSGPRDTPPLDAGAAFDRLAEGEGARLYPLEVAAVAVAALRSVDVPAMVAEVFAFPGERAPVDPSGKLGYHAVAVWPGGEVGEGEVVVLDPFEGHGEPPAPEDVVVKNDLEAVAAAMNLLAMHRMVNEAAVSDAFELSRGALRVDARSPTLRSALAAITLVSGGAASARQELESAAQLRRDGPRRNDLASLALAESDHAQAAREVGAVLEQYPDYAGARATLAAVHLAQGEVDAARRELELAERLDPELHNLDLLWANYYLATRQNDLAAQKALDAVEARPLEWQRRLQAAKVLRAVGRYDEMRRQARAALERVPDAQKDAIRELILDDAVLGPTALDEPFDETAEAEGLALPELDEGLDLAGGSTLLGDDPSPSLAPPMGPGSGETLLKLGDPSTLELRDPGMKLRLDGLGGE